MRARGWGEPVASARARQAPTQRHTRGATHLQSRSQPFGLFPFLPFATVVI